MNSDKVKSAAALIQKLVETPESLSQKPVETPESLFKARHERRSPYPKRKSSSSPLKADTGAVEDTSSHSLHGDQEPGLSTLRLPPSVSTVDLFVAMLRSADQNMRCMAAAELGEFDYEIYERLHSFFGDTDNSPGSEMRSPDIVQALADILMDPLEEEKTLLAASNAIAAIGPFAKNVKECNKQVLVGLKSLVKHSDKNVATAAQRALDRLRGKM